MSVGSAIASVSGTAKPAALWYGAGVPPVPIRWLLVRDPTGEFEPQAFLATDLNARPSDILAWFVSRWQVEVTFEETRTHLGVETQRQWSDKAERSDISSWRNGDISILRLHHSGRTPRIMEPSDFFHVTAEPRHYRNSRHIWRRTENALAYAA